MTKKPQQRTLVTRERILDAARALCASVGIEQVTGDAIAEKAGVAKGTVFAHFGDMDGLLSHVLLDDLRAILTADYSDKWPTDGNRLVAVNVMMMQFVEVVGQNRTMMRLFLKNTGTTDGSYAPEFIETLSQLDETLLQFLNAWKADTSLKPTLRDDREPAELMDGLVAFMTHVSVQCQCGQIPNMEEARKTLFRHSEAWLIA
ncbi:MAG: TetR/AcrR family transcriptional regulator [Rhodobacteraceae bacterium]|nr:TetR/AcrR family transcriptional regulator [Paracoccaceae bacterium]